MNTILDVRLELVLLAVLFLRLELLFLVVRLLALDDLLALFPDANQFILLTIIKIKTKIKRLKDKEYSYNKNGLGFNRRFNRLW
jgi:hypothetical protein